MIKTYSSSSIVSVRINGMRFRFNEAGKGSIYRTADKKEQDALENYSGFGQLYILSEEHKEESADAEIVATAPNEDAKKITVGSMAEARDILVESYGMTRTQLRSKEAIVQAAKENNVIFEGL